MSKNLISTGYMVFHSRNFIKNENIEHPVCSIFSFFYKISQNCSNWVSKVLNHKRILPECKIKIFQVDTGCYIQITKSSRC